MNDTTLKRTPLYEWHASHGGKIVDFGGWEMPVQYEDGILEEHLATRRYGGIFDVSHMGRFLISGRDTIPFLQHVLSNNAEALRPWQSQYTLIPNENGGVIDDAYLYRFGWDSYMLVVNAANTEKDLNHLSAQAKLFEDAALEDVTEQMCMIAFQGPLCGKILEEIIERGSLPEPQRNSLSEITVGGAEVNIGRTGYTGEPVAFELFAPAEHAAELWERLYTRGSGRGIAAVGLGGRDTLRLEAGLPLYGHEFGTDADGKEIPAFAVPLTRAAVSFSPRKGDFVGRRALRRQFEEVKKLREGTYATSDVLPSRIFPVALTEKGIARAGDEVYIGDTKAGTVTSGTAVPYWIFEGEGATMTITAQNAQRSIALACLDAGLLPGQELEIRIRKKKIAAQVVKYHGRSEAPPYFRPIPVGWEEPVPERKLDPAEQKALFLLDRSIENHSWRQHECINLIPSEMTPSPLVRLLSVSDPAGRYAEHKRLKAVFDQEVYYYQGTDFISWIEEQLAEEMSDYLGCPLIEARVISGQMANTTVFSALVDYRNRTDRRQEAERIRLAMTNDLKKGGHLSAQPMGALRHYVARDPVTERYAVVNFPVQKDNPYKIDIEATADILDRDMPEIIILGKSMVIHREPVSEMRRLVDARKKKPFIMYDMAHVLGIAGPHFQEPFSEGADIVTGSTHKTFFGTQRGVIGMNFDEDTPEYDLWDAVRRHAFPGQLSNHHLGTLLGLYMAALEMNAFKDEYQSQVIANARAFAAGLTDQGVTVEGDPGIGYTETHQVIVNVGYARGPEAARFLEENNIVVNYQALPSDEGFTASSGLRLGVAEMTRFGMKEEDFREFAGYFADAVSNGAPVKDRIAEFRKRFRTMHYCFSDDVTRPYLEKLTQTF